MLKNGVFKKKIILHGILAGLITAVAYALICFACDIAPLGDNTFLMHDLKRQYVDYYTYYKSVLSGENSPLYSFSTALGSGMIGFEIYYITSPFLMILAMFPQAMLPVGITVVIGIKLSIATFIMDMFLQYYLLKDDSVAVFSQPGIKIWFGAIAWGLSGFLFAHSMNMMWIDVVMLLPALIWALDRVILSDRKILYSLLISLILFLNYYISYQVLLFIAIWTLYRVWVLKVQKPLKAILRVVVMTFIGGICDAIVLLPTALELMDSPKDITQLGLKTKGNELSVFKVMSKAPALAYDYIEARFGWPQIYCGVLFVVLLIAFFISKKIEKREKIGIFVLMSILMVSFMSDEINLIWHAGMEPSGHPYRQAYLWAFLTIICGTKLLLATDAFYSLDLCIGTALTALIFVFSLNTDYDHITKLTIVSNYGILIFFIVTFGLCLFIGKKKPGTVEKLRLLLLTTLVSTSMAEIAANACYTYHFQSNLNTHLSEYKNKISDTAQAVDWIKSEDSSFYRMENLNPRQQNDSMQYTYNGITHYSSAGKTYVRYLLQRLGYNDDGLHANYGHDNTVTADMLLGVKYVVSDDVFPYHASYLPAYDGAVNAYRNPYALSVAVATDGFELDDISCPIEVISSDNWSEFVPKVNPFALQEEMVKRITGNYHEIFKSAEVVTNDYVETADDGTEYPRREFEVTAAIDGEMYMYLDGLLGSVQGLTLYKNGEVYSTYGNASCIKILNLGYMDAGDIVTIFIGDGAVDAYFGEAYFVTEDIAEVEKAYKELEGDNLVVEKKSSTYLTFDAGSCDGVFISIPCEVGWSAKVDGVDVDPVCVFGALTYIPVNNDQSSHHIEISFMPEGLTEGIAISLIGLVLLGIIIFLENKELKREKKSSK